MRARLLVGRGWPGRPVTRGDGTMSGHSKMPGSPSLATLVLYALPVLGTTMLIAPAMSLLPGIYATNYGLSMASVLRHGSTDRARVRCVHRSPRRCAGRPHQGRARHAQALDCRRRRDHRARCAASLRTTAARHRGHALRRLSRAVRRVVDGRDPAQRLGYEPRTGLRRPHARVCRARRGVLPRRHSDVRHSAARAGRQGSVLIRGPAHDLGDQCWCRGNRHAGGARACSRSACICRPRSRKPQGRLARGDAQRPLAPVHGGVRRVGIRDSAWP